MSAYADHHINSTLVRKIHAIRDKQRVSMKRSGLSAERFPHFPISRPAAAKIAEMAGVRKPRPGYLVDVAVDHDRGETWILGNRSGSYHLEAVYR